MSVDEARAYLQKTLDNAECLRASTSWENREVAALIGDVLDYLDDRPKVGDVIETVESLEALPLGSVFLDRHGDAWQRRTDCWPGMSSLDIDTAIKRAPFTVIHVGGDRDA